MIVMSNHDFLDNDIEKVIWDEEKEVREIVLSKNNEGSLFISKEDAVALAKDFGLLLFEKDSNL